MARIGTVIFDCDGVLLVSNRMKIRMFAKAAEAFGFSAEDVAWFRSFVAGNFGTSRGRMFEALLAHAGRPIDAAAVEALTDSYADLLKSEYLRCPTTPGARPLLDSLAGRGIAMFVVSGSAQDELRALFKKRDLAGYFGGIYGSPVAKKNNVAALLATTPQIDPATTLFVGDAEADFTAARATGLGFVYMRHYSTDKARMAQLEAEHGFPAITDLRQLQALLG